MQGKHLLWLALDSSERRARDVSGQFCADANSGGAAEEAVGLAYEASLVSFRYSTIVVRTAASVIPL